MRFLYEATKSRNYSLLHTAENKWQYVKPDHETFFGSWECVLKKKNNRSKFHMKFIQYNLWLFCAIIYLIVLWSYY